MTRTDRRDEPIHVELNMAAMGNPTRQFDYQATRDSYEGGDPIGHGATKEEAIADLLMDEEVAYG